MGPPPKADSTRVNDRIRVPRVLLIDENGEKLGEFLTQDAMSLARDRGLDLIEVAANARPPVCRIGDYGRLKYDKKKREAAARKRQHQVQLKEVKVRPKTDDHDMDVKIRHAYKFLSEGHKVKVTVRFRGREHAHHDIGAGQCMRLAEAVKDVGAVELHPRMDGRQMMMIIAPTRKPQPKPLKPERSAPRDEQADEEE